MHKIQKIKTTGTQRTGHRGLIVPSTISYNDQLKNISYYTPTGGTENACTE